MMGTENSMTLHNDPNPRLLIVRKLDGKLAIGIQGERREHPRVLGAFKAAEDVAYRVIRKEKI